MKMIYTLIAGSLFVFLLSFTRPSVKTGKAVYTELASAIEQQIEQDGSFSSCGDKIDRADISMNGDIQVHCIKNETVRLNIYQLYKTYKTIYGIELVNGNTIQFDLTGKGSFSLRFSVSKIAGQIYESLIALIMAGKDNYSPALPLDINETVDSINSMLKRLSAFDPQVKVNITGTMIITNNNMQFFHFNMTDLVSSEYTKEGFEVNGIEMVPCTYEKVAANNWINFNTANGRVAYLKFYEANDEEIAKLHQLFVHLRSSLLAIMYS